MKLELLVISKEVTMADEFQIWKVKKMLGVFCKFIIILENWSHIQEILKEVDFSRRMP